jgi:phosphate-selective porin OprO/OprP
MWEAKRGANWLFFFSLLFLLFSHPCSLRADDSVDKLKELIERQGRLIEQQNSRIEELQKRLDKIEPGGGMPVLAPTPLNQEPKPGVKEKPTDPKPDENSIRKMVANYLKEEDKKKKEEEDKKKKDQQDQGSVVGSSLGMTGRWDHGLWLESADKAFRIHPRGRVQFDTVGADAPFNVEYGKGGIGTVQNAVNFRRARLGVEGFFWEVINFEAEFDFVNTVDVDPSVSHLTNQGTVMDVPVPTDLWIQICSIPVVGNVRAGNIKPPVGLEHLTSSRFLDFMERGPNFDAYFEHGNNGFYPGFVAFNSLLEDRATWAASVFWNTRLPWGWNVGSGEWAGAWRLTGLPVYKEDGRCLVHVGLGVMTGELDEDIARFRVRIPIRNGNATLHNVVALARIEADHETFVSPELAVNFGPFSLQGEYTTAWVTGARRITDSYATFNPLQRNVNISPRTYFSHGGYLEALYFLTGENRQYNKKSAVFGRVIPYRPFFFVQGENGHMFSCGAWQVGLRYSYMDLNDNGILGGQLNEITAGLNWFLNPNFKIQWNYSWTHRTAPTSGANGEVNAVGMRLAFDF